MIPITQQDVLAHQAAVPWAERYQIEQDLLLCRAIEALFSDDFLKGQIAMRGGTVLHKIHLAPASRYSEDIDLVVIGDRPKEHIRAAIKRVLLGILGEPKGWGWDNVKLAVRNIAKPSEILRVTYEVPCVVEPGRLLTIVVEANISERKAHLPLVRLAFEFAFRGRISRVLVNSFDLHEMMGTKLRALFQRRRGRDLFDLYWAIIVPSGEFVDCAKIIESFQHYMTQEGTVVSREEFLFQFDAHLADAGFCSDMDVLLRSGASYDVQAAGRIIRERVLILLPE